MSIFGRLASRLFGGAPRPAELIVSENTSELLEAIDQARETLPIFWAWLDEHQESEADRAMKVGFRDRKGVPEYIWLADIRRTGPLVSGIVSNQPWRVAGMKEGDIVPFDLDRVIDWTFRLDGLCYGHFTTRVLAAANPSMAAMLTDMSSTPLPPDLMRH